MSSQVGSVLFVTPAWTRDGGVAAHAQASAAALAEQGVEVLALSARTEPAERAPGVRVLHSPALLDSGAPLKARLGPAEGLHPDLIHVHQLYDPELVRALRAIAPVVISVHGYPACTSTVYYFRPGQECRRAHGPACVPNLLARGCAHTFNGLSLPPGYAHASQALHALRQTELLVCYSSAVDRHLAANGLGRRRVVPLFTTMAPASGSGHDDRRRVVFAGRIVAPKGIDTLIRAAREVDAEFVVCGDGWRLAGARRLARRLGLERRVDFRGWLDAPQLAQEIADASVVAIPSLWPEPFGLVGIEALSAGRPVVASATGGICDWLQDGVNGLSVKPGDAGALAGALNELLADPARQRGMGLAGRRLVAERFSRERHLQELLDAYAIARASWRPAGAGVRGSG